MKEFILTQPYASLEEMLNSAEVGIYKEELQQCEIKKYAIVSRIGNRYDINGNKIEDFADNPFIIIAEEIDDKVLEIEEDEEDDEEGECSVDKYEHIKDAIEDLIDEEIEKVINELYYKHSQEIAILKEKHAQELEKVKRETKAELIAKLAN